MKSFAVLRSRRVPQESTKCLHFATQRNNWVCSTSTGAEHSASSFSIQLTRLLTAKDRIRRASNGLNNCDTRATSFRPGSSHIS
jgi:hypothetical protein